MVQLVHEESDVLSQKMSCNQKHQQQQQASPHRGSGFAERIMNKMAGNMHGRERRGEAVQTAPDKNLGTRRDTSCQDDTVGHSKCKNHKVKKTAQGETTHRVTAKL